MVEIPHVTTVIDKRQLDHEVKDKSDDTIKDKPFKSLSAEEHNKTQMTTSEIVTSSQSGIIATKLNITYTAAEVLSVLE